LHTLVLSFNRLAALDGAALAALPALRHLDVSHNALTRLEPAETRQLPAGLESLDSSHNAIARIGGLARCVGLRALTLSHNRLRSASGLEHLQRLEQLDLGHNLLSAPLAVRPLGFCRALAVLVLEGNPLAGQPRYRPTLTGLLPHVKAVDRRALPPS
ncbi:unnamed protein product, partial [Phaeothamnion confervicola]